MIQTLGRQADRALLAVGVMFDILLVQQQSELADEQQQEEQKPAVFVSHVSRKL